jgi:hypothetical protein
VRVSTAGEGYDFGVAHHGAQGSGSGASAQPVTDGDTSVTRSRLRAMRVCGLLVTKVTDFLYIASTFCDRVVLVFVSLLSFCHQYNKNKHLQEV